MDGKSEAFGAMWFALLLALKYALPLAVLGGVYAGAHDNLDSDVVYSIVTGRFLSGDPAAYGVFLNGTLDWEYFSRSFQPISLVYALLPPEPAYALTEAAFLALAFFGAQRLLSDCVPGAGRVLVLVSLVWAFGLSFTSFGLGLAAAPWVVWIAGRQAQFGWAAALGVLLIGLNSALALHSLFQPIGTLVCLLVLGLPLRRWRFVAVHGVLWFGAALGAVGILWNLAAGPPNHRSAWPAPTGDGMPAEFLTTTLSDILVMGSQYHATIVPAISAGFVIGAGVFAARARVAPLLVLIAAAAALAAFRPLYDWAMIGPLGSVQFDRIGLFAPVACLCLAAVLLGRGLHWLRWPLGASLGVFLLAGVGFSPATLKPLLPATARDVLAEVKESREWSELFGQRALGGIRFSRNALYRAATVAGHFRAAEYACLGSVIGEARVLSVGVDPMIAPANGLNALDGYHNLYPLSYKARFRPVIADKLAADAALRAYYDDWGSRVYAFGDRMAAVSPDYRAAERLGAGFVIAARVLEDRALVDVTPACARELRLYRISPD